MANVEDRWNDRNTKQPTDRHGKGLRWRVRYRSPDGKGRAQSFTKKVDADRFAATVETDKVRGLWVDPGRGKLTVEKWSQGWIKTKQDLRPTSYARLEGVLHTHVVPAFGETPLAEVGNAAVREWISTMKAEGVGASTIRKSYNALAEMMRAAVADRRVAFNPCEDVPLPVEQVGEQRYLTTTDVAGLADAIEPRFRAFALLAAYGGLRFGELAGLRRKRVDLLRGRVTIAETLVEVNGQLSFGPPKTKRSLRTVPLPRRIVVELERHLDEYVSPDPDALVFTGTKGAPLRRAGFRRCWWKPATAATGLDGFKVHEMRHTFVALWVAAGRNPKEVSVAAGHSSVAFTLDRYGHLYEDDDDLQDRLDELLDDSRVSPARPSVVTPISASGGK